MNRELIALEIRELREVGVLLRQLIKLLTPRLKAVTLHLSRAKSMIVGQTSTATVLGTFTDGSTAQLDPAKFSINYTLSDLSLATSQPALDGSDLIFALAPGSESLNVGVLELSTGKGFSDSKTFSIATPVPTLASISLQFSPSVD